MYGSKLKFPLLKFLLFSNQNENKNPLHTSSDKKVNNEIDSNITAWENFPQKLLLKFLFFEE